MGTKATCTISPMAIILFFAGFGSFLVAFFTGSLVAHLISALVLSFFAVSFVLARRSLDGLTVTRSIPSTAFDGDDVEVETVLRNDGAHPRSLVEVANFIYTSLAPTGRVSALAAEIFPGRTMTLTGTLPGIRRGEQVFPPPLLISGDPFGMFTATRIVDETECPTARLSVFPKPFDLERMEIESDLSWTMSGLESMSQAGTSGDFLGTREYRPGDSVRAIHWPLSARVGELIVKEFERTASTEVTIFLDLDANAVWGEGRTSTFEYSVRLAASVASYAAQQGNSVQLAAHASQWVVVPPGKGQHHLQLIMHCLAALQPTASVPYTYVIGEMAPQLKEGSSAIVIFPSERLQLDLFRPALEALWARRVRLTAIILNVASFLHPEAKPPAVDRRAISYLASHGARVHIVSCGDNVAARLSAPG